MRKPADPFWWLLFAAGGTVTALLTPILILLTGLAAPASGAAGAFAYDRLSALAAHPLTRLGLFALIALSFFHWAHRFRYTLEEGLALKRAWIPVAAVCYGTAVVGAAAAAAVILAL